MYLAADTWVQLNYGISATYILLGAAAFVWPRPIARFFYLPYSTPESRHAGDVETLTPLLGARDIVIGLALYAALRKQDWNTAATLVFAGQVANVSDAVVAFRKKGFWWYVQKTFKAHSRGMLMVLGATSWLVSAYGLKYWQ